MASADVSGTRRKLEEAKVLDEKFNETRDEEETSDQTKSADLRSSVMWKSAFSHMNAKRRREIIRNMWRMPMAAQNLAARLLQSAYRGHITRQWQQKDNWWESMSGVTLQERLRRDAQRAHLVTTGSFGLGLTLEDKYTENFVSIYGDFPGGGYRAFAAAKIQSIVRMRASTKRVTWLRFRMYHIAAMEIQYLWRAYRRYRIEKTKRRYAKSEVRGALIVQRRWRRYADKKIYIYFRDLIRFRNAGDPYEMLKSVSPSDAGLCDVATKMFVRFRLGGYTFPPTIYYKVFTNGSVCDVNAFAPRNYAEDRMTSDEQASKSKPPRDVCVVARPP